MSRVFKFKQFELDDAGAAMKVGTDAVLLGCVAAHPHPAHILDIGTGSGLIALQLAQRFAHAQVHAVELDESAAAQALSNFQSSPWSDRLHAHHADFLEWSTSLRFDLMVCNPPFYPNSFPIEEVARRNARVQNRLDLATLAQRIGQLVSSNTLFYYVLPSHFHPQLAQALAKSGWYLHHQVDIKPKADKANNRVIAGWGKTRQQPKLEELCLRKEDGSYTEAYLELTRDFYLFA